jgi:thermitase
MKYGTAYATGFIAMAFLGMGLTFYSSLDSGSVDLSSSSPKKERLLELNASTKATLNKEESVIMNDPAIQQAWGLKKSDASRAWSVSQGSRDLRVCVIDTGADIHHEDLAGNIWDNPGETGKDSKGRDRATNGVDDDGNGYIDDAHGWNFVSNNGDLTDNHGHGTHIAGIIGAQAGNGKGVAGIAPLVSLMILKYYDPKVAGTDNLKNTVNSIKYCIQMNANIINYSGGGTEYSKDEHDAIEEARQKGILFVAAAGNERSNSDKHKYYPADYGLSNIISVTAIDPSTEVLASSNYGMETVDIAAPGQNILSTLPKNAYGYMTGTSQATAFVTGAAVLVMAHKDQYVPEDIKKYILATGDSQASLLAKCRTSKQLNLFKALTVLDSVTASGLTTDDRSPSFGVGIAGDLNSVGSAERAISSSFGKALIQALETKSLKTN